MHESRERIDESRILPIEYAHNFLADTQCVYRELPKALLNGQSLDVAVIINEAGLVAFVVKLFVKGEEVIDLDHLVLHHTNGSRNLFEKSALVKHLCRPDGRPDSMPEAVHAPEEVRVVRATSIAVEGVLLNPAALEDKH